MIKTVEIAREGHVRRSKLYYLRERIGKRARVRQRRPGAGGAVVAEQAEEAAAPAEEENQEAD